jgi:hypothetical protein
MLREAQNEERHQKGWQVASAQPKRFDRKLAGQANKPSPVSACRE